MCLCVSFFFSSPIYGACRPACHIFSGSLRFVIVFYCWNAVEMWWNEWRRDVFFFLNRSIYRCGKCIELRSQVESWNDTSFMKFTSSYPLSFSALYEHTLKKKTAYHEYSRKLIFCGIIEEIHSSTSTCPCYLTNLFHLLYAVLYNLHNGSSIHISTENPVYGNCWPNSYL